MLAVLNDCKKVPYPKDAWKMVHIGLAIETAIFLVTRTSQLSATSLRAVFLLNNIFNLTVVSFDKVLMEAYPHRSHIVSNIPKTARFVMGSMAGY